MSQNEIAQSSTMQVSFISKVFVFFGLAVLVSAASAYIGLNYLAQYFISTTAIYAIFAVELILIFTSKLWSQRAPLNYFLFLAFASITGLTLVPLLGYVIAVTGSLNLVIQALLAASLMFAAAAIFGYTTNISLTGLRGFLIMSILGMIVVSILGIFLPWGSTFEMIFAGFGVIIFTGYTMYDLQAIKSYSENQYIDAALQLYLDLFNLFIYILRLIMSLNRN